MLPLRHMTKLTTLDDNDLFNEVSDIARTKGVHDLSGWMEIVDEVVDGHLDWAELDPDQNLDAKKEVLGTRWEEYKRRSGEESADAITEDPDAPHA